MTINELAQQHNLDVSGFWVWIGQNATTGTPHPQTGNLSLYGDFKHFNTRKERDEFYDNYHHINNRVYKCTVKTGRKFKLGCSVADYLEWLAMVKSGYIGL